MALNFEPINTRPVVTVPQLTDLLGLYAGSTFVASQLSVGNLLAIVIPSQVGNNGKFLMTNGSVTSWHSIATGGVTSIGGATGIVWSGSTFNPADTTMAEAFARDSAANPAPVSSTTFDSYGAITVHNDLVLSGYNRIYEPGGNGIQLYSAGPSGVIVLASGQGVGLADTSSSISTPTSSSKVYSTAGVMHVINASGATAPLPVYDTGWTADVDAGDKTHVITDSATLLALSVNMNAAVAGSGDAMIAVCQTVKALKAALSSSPPLLPNN